MHLNLEDIMAKIDNLYLLRERKVVAIMRAKNSEELIDAAEAICAGGISVIEVTMTTPNALNVIEKARAKFKNEVLFGAGSVLDPETARAAILAGAQFVVCPTLKLETIWNSGHARSLYAHRSFDRMGVWSGYGQGLPDQCWRPGLYQGDQSTLASGSACSCRRGQPQQYSRLFQSWMRCCRGGWRIGESGPFG
jgi:KDPG and KHG aldolase